MDVLIIEDEKAAAKRLINQLAEIRHDYRVLECIDTVEYAINWFNANPLPDLVFLDIQLADGTCFEIFEQVRSEIPVIFTTAYDSYAIKSFELNSIDYLLKPVSIDKLSRALDKFDTLQDYFQKNLPSTEIINKLSAFITNKKPYKSRFLIPQPDGYLPLLTDDISYFYFESNKVYIISKTGEKYNFNYSLDRLEKELDPNLFYRANRSFIVSVSSIKKIHNYFNYKIKLELMPSSRKELIISRLRVNGFKKWYNG